MSKCPNNCGAEGPHFAPPSMGEPGFFTCKNDPAVGPPVNPITTADDPDAFARVEAEAKAEGEALWPMPGDKAPEENKTLALMREAKHNMPTLSPNDTPVAPEVNAQVAALVERMKLKRESKSPVVLNAKLQAVDEIIQSIESDPQTQIAILTLAVVLATRRALAALKIKDRGRRSKLLKAMSADFEAKLRRYVAG